MSGFLTDLAALVRADDPYGRFDRFTDEQLLKPFVVSGGIDLDEPTCTLDPAVVANIRRFHQAVARGAERATGVMTSVTVDLDHEGFGTVLVTAGRLIALHVPMRDAGGFGFPSQSTLIARGEALAAQAAAVIDKYPEVARDDT